MVVGSSLVEITSFADVAPALSKTFKQLQSEFFLTLMLHDKNSLLLVSKDMTGIYSSFQTSRISFGSEFSD